MPHGQLNAGSSGPASTPLAGHGFQALSARILGIYVAQVLMEVKRRPLFSGVESIGLDADRLNAVARG